MSTLDVWDSHLATAGAELLAARLDLVEALRPLVDKAYAAVSATGPDSHVSTGPAVLAYRSSLADGPDSPLPGDRESLAAALLDQLAARRTNELERGVCLVGPHRDDLVLTLGAMPAKGYASHGESWSYALALRLASYDLLRGEADDGAEPVLVLDDVFAELDDFRRARLAAMVADAEQVLVTAAVDADVPEALRGDRVEVLGSEVRRG